MHFSLNRYDSDSTCSIAVDRLTLNHRTGSARSSHLFATIWRPLPALRATTAGRLVARRGGYAWSFKYGAEKLSNVQRCQRKLEEQSLPDSRLRGDPVSRSLGRAHGQRYDTSRANQGASSCQINMHAASASTCQHLRQGEAS